MALHEDVQTLLQKEMDRKDFLRHLGIGLAAIIGITTVLKTISSLGSSDQKQQGTGYGSGVYGGGRK
jgi:hypothetical protein